MMNLRVPVHRGCHRRRRLGRCLGIGVADHVMILENAYYSVISPEACSAILWKDRRHAARSGRSAQADRARFDETQRRR